MNIRRDDGRYGLDCWLSKADSEKDEPQIEYSDKVTELRERAEVILKAGRYRYLELSRWDDDKNEWEVLQVYEPE